MFKSIHPLTTCHSHMLGCEGCHLKKHARLVCLFTLVPQAFFVQSWNIISSECLNSTTVEKIPLVKTNFWATLAGVSSAEAQWPEFSLLVFFFFSLFVNLQILIKLYFCCYSFFLYFLWSLHFLPMHAFVSPDILVSSYGTKNAL